MNRQFHIVARRLLLLSLPAAVLACSSEPRTSEVAQAPAAPAQPAAPVVATAAPAQSAAPPAPTGFDPAAAPVANPTLGAFPFFSLIDGYQPGDMKNMASTVSKEYLREATFDRYEFFDGTKLIAVEGRLSTRKALGKGASFFQVQKTYEKLTRDLGGVTVYEGPAQKMVDLKLKYAEGRHRHRYMPEHEALGVYMLRTPDREFWTEVYKVWDDQDNYWVTVVEKKGLEMKAAVLPAEQLKKELDANGHVALYLTFDTDKATIKPESQPVVDEVLKLLQTNPALRLAVEGHTDNAGTPEHNQQLSEQRAQAVVAALTARQIPADRLRAAGFGQSKPLADNATEDGKAKNRRVELVRL